MWLHKKYFFFIQIFHTKMLHLANIITFFIMYHIITNYHIFHHVITNYHTSQPLITISRAGWCWITITYFGVTKLYSSQPGTRNLSGVGLLLVIKRCGDYNARNHNILLPISSMRKCACQNRWLFCNDKCFCLQDHPSQRNLVFQKTIRYKIEIVSVAIVKMINRHYAMIHTN